MSLVDQASIARSNFDRWLGKHNGDDWSFARLNDAQKQSLLWIGVSLIVAVTFWKGFPKTYDQVQEAKLSHHDYVRDKHGRPVLHYVWRFEWFSKLAPLAPLKYLTVLFHEICHALVGWVTGGKVVLITVQWNEGGATYFDENSSPSHAWTLPAGYVGSCTIGCLFVFAGFDTVASKVAAVTYGAMALACLIICMSVLTKSHIHHDRYKWRLQLAKWRNDEKMIAHLQEAQKAKQAREKGESKWEKDNGVSHKDKMASIEVILLCTLFVGAIIFVAWFLYDSLYLRFVVLFVGLINAIYAIWDVHLDGITYGKVASSDCTAMAAVYNRQRKPENHRSVAWYANVWLISQSALLVGTIILALYVWQDNIAEQALHSRNTFLATSRHYTPVGLSQSVKEQASEWIEGVTQAGT